MDEQSGAGQQHQRHRDLRHDEDAAERAHAAARRCAPRAALEHDGQIRAQGVKHRDQADEQADHGGERDGECEHAPVERRRQRLGQHLRQVVVRHPQRPPGHSQAQESAETSQQQAFHEELPGNRRARGPERGSNGQLGLAGVGTYKEEIGHVDAADEQHEGDAALQHQERRSHRLHALLLHPADVHRHAGALHESLQGWWARVDVALLQGLGLGVRLAGRDTRFEASKQLGAHAVAALRILRGRRPAQRHDELHTRIKRFQLPRRHADHLVRFIVDAHLLADDLWTLLILRLPVGPREHDDLVGARFVLVFCKKGPEQGLYPQDVEDFGGHPYTGRTDDRILVSDQAVRERPQPKALVGGRVLRVVEVERDVGRHMVQASLRRGRVQLHNPLRLLVRQRLQHQRIDRREDRRRRADAQRQRDERRGGDPLGLPQETEGLTKVRKGAGQDAARRRR